MNTYGILLLEDDINDCKKITDYVSTLDDFNVVSINNDSNKAIKDIKKYQPHALILDLELHKGCGSGLDVLKALPSLKLTRFPYIVITTNNVSNITYEIARKLGADYIFYKHEADYSAKKIIELLRLAITIPKTGSYAQPDDEIKELSAEEKDKTLKKEIQLKMDVIGISPKYLGYEYLIEAITLAVNNNDDNLYATLGKFYSKTSSSIERAMQTAINKTWNTADTDTLLNEYTARIDPRKGCPTVMEFVYYYANILQDV